MIERLNFYDLYGHLLPGVTLISLLWLPYVLVYNSWPSLQWTSTIIVIVFGYIIGHIFHRIAEEAIPSKIKFIDPSKKTEVEYKYPSDILLDDGNTTFPAQSKERLLELIKTKFGIDAHDRANREMAFMSCRSWLCIRRSWVIPSSFRECML